MCGIIGAIDKVVDIDLLNLIHHRGPDDRGILDLCIGDREVYLGHVRLSIQDLSSAGHQPMFSSCGNYVIVFNGEIYNHLELREKLSNIDFKGHSDTETIVNYIARYGLDSVRDFNGIFAFAFLDIKKEMLYLVRDRFGVKPIYYTASEDSFQFSSEIRPISLLSPGSLNLDHLATLLKLRYNPAPTTLYGNIQKLRSGHILSCNVISKKHEIISFISPVERPAKTKPFDLALLEYEKLFGQAVKRQMLADVEVGVLLSGGLDSALVAYYAQKYSNQRIKTFTVGFGGSDENDETEDARETARVLGTDHYEININEDQFEDVFEECIRIIEEPLGTTSVIPMYFLNKLVSKYVKVVLTGQGADEPLGGYTRYLGEKMYGKIPPFLIRMARPLSIFVSNENIYRTLNSLGEKNRVKRFEAIYALFSDTEIKNLIGVADSKSHELITYFYHLLGGESKDGASAMMSNDLRMQLSDDLLLYTDKISMNFSIEARVPFLDNDLVDFFESLPLQYKISGKEGKYIHKKFAEKILPKEIVYRKKKGFKSPTKQWFVGKKGHNYKSMLMCSNSVFANFFNTEYVGRLFDIHASGKRNLEKQLFTLIAVYYWLKNQNRSC